MDKTVRLDRVELRLDAPAGGGSSVGRDSSGRATFAEGGLPGELVEVELHTHKKRFAKGRVVEVLEPVSGRQTPPCPTAHAGCGGCDLAHAQVALQHEIKRHEVADALTRIGKVQAVPEIALHATEPRGYRTTVRAGVLDGQAGYRRRWSHEIVPAPVCLVAHPAIEDLMANGRWGDSSEVVLRTSVATGERLAIVDGDPADVEVPADVIVVSSRKRDAQSRLAVAISERVADRDWRVSADSFFQAGPLAADALVEAVGQAAGDVTGLRLVDAYCGVGLFAGTAGQAAAHVIAIERAPSSAADARFNLDPAGDVPAADTAVEVVEAAVEAWTPEPVDVVVADPARAGLGHHVVDALAATDAHRFVLVSCHTGSMGRDVGLLQDRGFHVDSVTIVDAFPETSHIEAVVGLVR